MLIYGPLVEAVYLSPLGGSSGGETERAALITSTKGCWPSFTRSKSCGVCRKRSGEKASATLRVNRFAAFQHFDERGDVHRANALARSVLADWKISLRGRNVDCDGTRWHGMVHIPGDQTRIARE